MQDKTTLPGHPEAFEIDEQRNRIFINVPEKQQIVIAERQGSHARSIRQLQAAQQNFPMALDIDADDEVRRLQGDVLERADIPITQS